MEQRKLEMSETSNDAPKTATKLVLYSVLSATALLRIPIPPQEAPYSQSVSTTREDRKMMYGEALFVSSGTAYNLNVQVHIFRFDHLLRLRLRLQPERR